jgi:hypothetical protein
VTDSPDPTDRPPRRSKSGRSAHSRSQPSPAAQKSDPTREPPILDLTANRVEEPAPDVATAATDDVPADTPPADTLPGAPAEAPPGLAADSLEAAPSSAQDESPVASPEPEPAAPPVAPERRGLGFGALLGAGLVGGIAGAGLLHAYDTYYRPPAPDPRVAILEQRVAALPRPDALPALERRLAALEGAQARFDERVQGAQVAAERALARAEEAARPAAPAAAATAAPSQAAPALADLSNRLATLERDTAARADQLAALDRDARSRADQGQEAVQGLDRRVAEQENRLSALGQQVATLTDGSAEAARVGTRVVLADRLSGALREGTPLGPVLAALPRYGVDPARLAPLQPYAERGAPTAAALGRDFEDVRERILREARPGDSDLWDRLARMADRVVTIRAVDEPGATSPGALVARIEDALERGAFSEALSAYQSLPEPARRVSEAFGSALRQRAAAEDAARTVAAEAVSALRAPTRSP